MNLKCITSTSYTPTNFISVMLISLDGLKNRAKVIIIFVTYFSNHFIKSKSTETSRSFKPNNGRTTFFQVPHPKKRGSLCLSRTFSSDFVIGDAAAPPATSDAGITPRARAPLISCPRARDCSGLEFLDATGPGTVLCYLLCSV